MKLFSFFKKKVAPTLLPKQPEPIVERFDHPTGGKALRITYLDGRVAEVCATCLGNCGQCGTSLGRGYPPQMDALIRNIT